MGDAHKIEALERTMLHNFAMMKSEIKRLTDQVAELKRYNSENAKG